MSARGTFQLMSRLERAATTAGSDVSACETVRSSLVELLKDDGAAAAPFVAKLLGGGLGADAALVGWRTVVARGIVIAGEDSPAPVRASFAAYCMFRGRLDILRQVALQVPLDSVPPEVRPSDRSQLLDLLCTTKSEREHPSFQGMDLISGLVGVAAANAKDCGHASEALQLAWEVNPEHCGFDDLAEEASEEGAFVRSFLMNKGIELAAAPVATGATQASRARPKRSV